MAKSVTVSKDLLQNAAALAGGAVLGRMAGSKVAALLPSSVPGAFANVVPVGIGLFLMTRKNSMAVWAGAGMVAAGGSRFLGELIPAIGAPGKMLNPNTRKFLYSQNSRKAINLPASQANLGFPASQANLGFPADQAILSDPFNEEITRQF
jgi:hypothetical protein